MAAQQQKLVGVHPRLVAAYIRIASALAELGHPILITDGVRTVEQQQALYAKGRTIKGEPPYTVARPLGRTVTQADGVHARSNHQTKADGFGHAIDCAFLDAAGRPSWDEDHPWRLYGEAAKSQGLRWGGDWERVDRPHIELPEDPA